jgi:isocitrate/isopropylmalate dehydrogenase
MYPSGNIDDKYAYFEPIHGSAPDIAGKGIANPLSQISSNAMLLEHIGETAAGQRIKNAVCKACEEGDITIDERRRASKGTTATADAIISKL